MQPGSKIDWEGSLPHYTKVISPESVAEHLNQLDIDGGGGVFPNSQGSLKEILSAEGQRNQTIPKRFPLADGSICASSATESRGGREKLQHWTK